MQLSEWCDASQRKEAVEGPLFKIFWRRIILDEGHSIKNHKAAMSIAVNVNQKCPIFIPLSVKPTKWSNSLKTILRQIADELLECV